MFFDFLHTYQPFAVLVDVGFLTIHWYGLLMVFAVIVGFTVSVFLFGRYGVSRDVVYDLGFFLVIFGFLGARFYHVVNEIGYYWARPWEVFAVWNGGLALHGALIAGLIVLMVYTRKHVVEQVFFIKTITQENNKTRRYALLLFADILAPVMVLGQAIGRWGNYFNQELYGLPCDFAWCIPIDVGNRVSGFEQFVYFHPTFFYESLLNVVIFGVLMFLHMRRLRCIDMKTVQHENIKAIEQTNNVSIIRRPGVIAAVYLILYSLVRAGMELIRIDQTPIIFGVRLPILVSGIFIVAGIVFLWHSKSSIKVREHERKKTT